jgi:MFS family permease
MSRTETLLFLNVAHFFDHFFLLIFPTAALAIAAEGGMSYGTALALGTPVYVAFALGTLPAGWLGDRYDRTVLTAMFFLGCGSASALIALSPNQAAMMTGLAALGLFAALYHPVGLALVADVAVRTGRALAVNGVFGNLGLAGAAVVTGLLCDHLGWRSAFLIPGLLSMGLGALLLTRRLRLGPAESRRDLGQQDRTVDAARRTQLTVFAVVCVSALFGGLVFNGVTVSLPKLFDERLALLGGDLSRIGAYAGLVFAVAAFAQLPVGEMLDRYGARPILILLLSAQAILLVGLAGAEGWLVVVLALPLVTLMFAEIPVTSWLLGRYVQSGLRARAISAEYVLSLGIGSGVVPLIAGLHGLGIGSDLQYRGLALSALVVFAAAWFLPRLQRPRATAAPQAAE